MFIGNAINDWYLWTVMGYIGLGKLIIMVIEGRFLGRVEGVILNQEA